MTRVAESPTALSNRLREATAAAHERAEAAPFLTELLGGRLTADAWADLLEQYQYVYGALEETAGRLPDNTAVSQLLFVELNRTPAITADLARLREHSTRPPLGMLASTRAYVERIQACEFDTVRYLAHHYVRYLGDLSGGQVMRVWLARHYRLTDAETTFFDFAEIGKPVQFKRRYRELLDALPFDDVEQQRLCAEAAASFDANEAIFEELSEIELPAVAA